MSLLDVADLMLDDLDLLQDSPIAEVIADKEPCGFLFNSDPSTKARMVRLLSDARIVSRERTHPAPIAREGTLALD